MSSGKEDQSDDLSKASTAVVDDVFVNDSIDSSQEGNEIHTLSEENKRKPFLGGYKHKLTGVTYHHATTQTMRSPWNFGMSETFCRDAQTVRTKDKAQQTPRNSCTQVEVRNIFMQTSNDRFIAPSDEYVFADEIKSEVLSKVLVVQKYIRRWLARKELQRRKGVLMAKLSWEEEQRKSWEKRHSDWLKSLKRRRLHPIAEDDFLLLFSDLQNWWEEEVKVISEKKMGMDQNAAMWNLINTEAKKIAEINKTKVEVDSEKLINNREKLLNEAGKPKMWKAYKKEIPVITESTKRGQDLQNLYTTLSLKCISTQDRIDALQSLIKLLQKYNYSLTNSLLQLAQREVDLLLRGTKPKNLEGLRARIQDMFWQYVKQPALNPHMQVLPKLKKIDGKDPYIFCCPSCKQFYSLPPDTVNEVVGKSVLGNTFTKCKKCLYLENEGWIRKDTELYKKILKTLIEDEERNPSLSSIIYILQPCDVKHLIEVIWKRQSCLSGSADEKELEFIRYNKDENWTPWNCMLVTREEAVTLSRIDDPKSSYDDDFKKFVYKRHIAARSYFATIPRFLPYVAKSIINKDYKFEDCESD